MTLVVGILCLDGAVLASDSDATFGTPSGQLTIGQQASRKVEVIDSAVLIATAGAVGLSQSIRHAIGDLWSKKGLADLDSVPAKDKLASVIRHVFQPAFDGARQANGVFPSGVITQGVTCSTLICVPIRHRPQLYSFDPTGQGEAASANLPFVSIGSGQPMADPFLAFLRRIFWPDRLPTVSEGVFAAAWTIDHVTRNVPGFVGGDLQLATVEKDGSGKPSARMHPAERLEDHRRNVCEAEAYLAAFRDQQRDLSSAPAVPEAPKLPAPSK